MASHLERDSKRDPKDREIRNRNTLKRGFYIAQNETNARMDPGSIAGTMAGRLTN
jgi:hypothetical protein